MSTHQEYVFYSNGVTDDYFEQFDLPRAKNRECDAILQ